ncbi:MAG TPA: FAD-dependent oxidoreductase [Acidimicrobiia bacterium]|nr:FAD-dependent oxidoreductase [Acidimicrobiia bacterium]
MIPTTRPPRVDDADARCYWTDATPFPEPMAPPPARGECDLAIVGAGYTGLWAALQAVERDPDRHVVVLEAEQAGFGASTRNGGFIDSSLTHGVEHGRLRFPDEHDRLVDLGRENWDGLLADLDRYGIDAGVEITGQLSVATEPYQLEGLDEYAALLREHGETAEVLDAAATRAEIESPTFLGSLWQRTSTGVCDPARLVFGLRDAAVRGGVTLHERAPVTALHTNGAGVRLEGPWGRLRASKVLLATNGFPPLVRSIRRTVVPVYDYVLVTEPLDAARRGAVGWDARQGLTDSGNRFHYSRLTADDRILWGGYDAIYHFGSKVAPHLEERPATFALLARQFAETFPALEGIRFTHRWAGVIDTSSRFAVSFGTSHRGRVAYAVGYTGLGVVASRFGARVALDRLDDPDSRLTRMRFVRERPFPFPPEPFRWIGVTLTRRALARADRRQGRRGPWLRLLDRFGIGFDS